MKNLPSRPTKKSNWKKKKKKRKINEKKKNNFFRMMHGCAAFFRMSMQDTFHLILKNATSFINKARNWIIFLITPVQRALPVMMGLKYLGL